MCSIRGEFPAFKYSNFSKRPGTSKQIFCHVIWFYFCHIQEILPDVCVNLSEFIWSSFARLRWIRNVSLSIQDCLRNQDEWLNQICWQDQNTMERLLVQLHHFFSQFANLKLYIFSARHVIIRWGVKFSKLGENEDEDSDEA